jgi:transposase-like protein
MPTIRDSKKDQLWEERLRAFQSGQHTVREFCQRLGISQANFYYWKRKLAVPGTKRGAKRGQPTSRPSQSNSFLPVLVKPTTRSVPSLSIRLPSGVRVRVSIDGPSSSNEVA